MYTDLKGSFYPHCSALDRTWVEKMRAKHCDRPLRDWIPGKFLKKKLTGNHCFGLESPVTVATFCWSTGNPDAHVCTYMWEPNSPSKLTTVNFWFLLGKVKWNTWQWLGTPDFYFQPNEQNRSFQSSSQHRSTHKNDQLQSSHLQRKQLLASF